MRTEPYFRPKLVSRIVACLLLTAPQTGWTLGTPAGTVISSSATVTYSLAGSPETQIVSAAPPLLVDELIQPLVTWLDAAPVAVTTPGANASLTFLLTNGGNGSEAFRVSRTNGPQPLPAGNYTPLDGSIGSIFLENGLQAGFQQAGLNADTAYISGVNDPILAPDSGQILYVVSNTPDGLVSTAEGDVLLTVASLTAGAAGSAPGTSLAGAGEGGVIAVVGANGAQASATGSYVASGLGVAVNKSVASVLDPGGTAVPMPGAVLTWRIEVVLSGTGTATNLVITDPLPAGTSYVAGSLSIDGASKTDVADADNAQFSANTVTVSLGDVAAPANVVITFRATID